MTEKSRQEKIHPVSRLAIAAVLIVWTGANFCVNLFQFREIMAADNRFLSFGLAAISVVLPLAIALWLLRSVSKSANS